MKKRYKLYKNKLTSVLSFCKREYYSKLLESHKNNIKETWKVLNGVINKNHKTKSMYPDTFVDNDREVNGKCIADGFNKFFTNIGSDLAASIPEHNNSSINDYLHDKNTHSMFLVDTTKIEILNIVRNLSNKTSVD